MSHFLPNGCQFRIDPGPATVALNCSCWLSNIPKSLLHLELAGLLLTIPSHIPAQHLLEAQLCLPIFRVIIGHWPSVALMGAQHLESGASPPDFYVDLWDFAQIPCPTIGDHNSGWFLPSNLYLSDPFLPKRTPVGCHPCPPPWQPSHTFPASCLHSYPLLSGPPACSPL